MIDIHCHILPDVDDGANDQMDALNMARMAALSGVTDIAATPHVMGDESAPERMAEIRQKFLQMKDLLKKEEMQIRLHPGAEVLCLPGTPVLAARHQLPTLGRGNYVLAEKVDGTMLVVRQDYTAACDINDAIDSLRMYKAGFLGVILNDMVTSQRGRYGYHYGGQYGQTRSHGESHHNSTGKEK